MAEKQLEIIRKIKSSSLDKLYSEYIKYQTNCRTDRKSAKMKNWKKKVLNRDNNKCVICSDNVILEVHHIKDFFLYPNLRFDVNNGITLCVECHKKLHLIERLGEIQND